MRKFVIACIALFLVVAVAQQSFSGTLDDIRRKVGRKPGKKICKVDKTERIIDIQSVRREVVKDFVFDKGAGTRMVRAINVKFRINKRGMVNLPYLSCYLYDRNKKQVIKLTKYLVLTVSGSKNSSGGSSFKGKRTHTIQFVYPNSVIFKYYLAVLGNNKGGISAVVMPRGNNIDDFYFPEKKYMKKNR